MNKAIFGAGGFGREIYWSLSDLERINTIFFVEDQYFNGKNQMIRPISEFDPDEYELIIAIADPKIREKIVNSLPHNTKYFTHIHKSVQIHDPSIIIGEGSVICAGSIITTNIVLGKHTHLNLQTTIGHDTVIGDYFTTAPGSKISGNCKIGNQVYVGTNSSIKEKLSICDNVTLGLNCGVVKNIDEPGTYVGTPAKKIK